MKKEQNKNSRKKVIAILVMLSLVLTTGTFAYWASYVEGTDAEVTETLVVGSGDTIETTFDISDDNTIGGLLVPVGQAVNSSLYAIEEINLSFDVQWYEDEDQTQTYGIDSIGQIVIDHELLIVIDGEELDHDDYSDIYDLVNVLYSEDNATDMYLDNTDSFSFQITMDEPANQEEYNLIAFAEISVTFSFTIDTDDIESTDY